MINNASVALTGTGPSFHNTLSAGDRNTLALAFFFASLDRDPSLADKIVVIDDPMTSLDEHRPDHRPRNAGAPRSRQPDDRAFALQAVPSWCLEWRRPGCKPYCHPDRPAGCRINPVRRDVTQDAVTEHDRRHALVSDYIANGSPQTEREAAQALRPILEAFMRVAFPAHYPRRLCSVPSRDFAGSALELQMRFYHRPTSQNWKRLKTTVIVSTTIATRLGKQPSSTIRSLLAFADAPGVCTPVTRTPKGGDHRLRQKPMPRDRPVRSQGTQGVFPLPSLTRWRSVSTSWSVRTSASLWQQNVAQDIGPLAICLNRSGSLPFDLECGAALRFHALRFSRIVCGFRDYARSCVVYMALEIAPRWYYLIKIWYYIGAAMTTTVTSKGSHDPKSSS